MAVVYGLTDSGFVVKPLAVIRDELSAAVQLKYGSSVDVSDGSILGQLIGIIAERLALLWELLEQIVSSQDPAKATKTLLDALCLFTGTVRPDALPSTATLTYTGTASSVVPSGSFARTASTGAQFVTTASTTLVAVPAWTITTAYALGARVTNFGNAYQCIQAGTSAGTPPGPGGTAPDLVLDGTCKWTYVGAGTAAGDAPAESVDTGPVVAAYKDITVPVTLASGVSNVVNLAAATLGRNVATDEELRILRELELSTVGNSPVDAIRAALLEITGVTAATVFENVTDATDSDGMPPHSIEALVTGGADQDIGDALLANVAAGIQTASTASGPNNVSVTSLDSQGISHTEKFSRPTEVPIYMRISLTKDAAAYPSDGDTQVKTAIANFGALAKTGKDAVASQLGAQAFTVTGVFDVSQILIYTDVIGAPAAWIATHAYSATVGSRSVVTNDGGRAYICITAGTSAGSGGPTGVGSDITDGTAHWAFLGNTIAISSRQRATYSSANMTVVSTSGTP